MSTPTNQPHTVPHPTGAYQYFHTNAAICYLAQHNKWTISDNNARPINIQALVYDNRIYGARHTQLNTDTVTLDKLNVAFPDAANATFYAQALSDHMLVIDIEKTCPPDIAQKLLCLPGALYHEISKSGRGYHMLVPLPDDEKIREQLAAITLTALRSPGGHFEVLLNHWVTFTRNQVTAENWNTLCHRAAQAQAQSQRQANTNVASRLTAAEHMSSEGETDDAVVKLREFDYSSVNTLIGDLIAHRNATAVAYASISVDEEMLEHVHQLPHYEQLHAALSSAHYSRTLDHYDGDLSRFEFAFLGWLNKQLTTLIKVHGVADNYTPDARAVMIYEVATELLDHRDKHDTTRCDMPYLLYSATRITCTDD